MLLIIIIHGQHRLLKGLVCYPAKEYYSLGDEFLS
jgi:hypothetical protein